MGWVDERGNPVTDPGLIQQLELADQGQKRGGSPQEGPPQKTLFGQTVAPGTETRYEPNPFEGIFTGAGIQGLPAIGRSIGRGLGSFFGSPPARKEVIEDFAQQLGLKPTAQRLSEGREPVQRAFQAAEEVPGEFPIGKTASKQSTLLDEFGRPVEIPGRTVMGSYKDLLDKEQTLAFKARKMADPVKKAALNDERGVLLDQMADISLAGPQANTVAFKDIAGKAIMARIESGGSNLLGKMDILLQRKPQYLKAFGIDSPQAVEAFRSMVQNVERTPMNPESKAAIVGKWLLRHSAYVAIGAGAGAAGLYGMHRFGG